MKAVLDTVVYVRAVLNPNGLWGRVVFHLSDRYDLVLSPPIAAEILDVVTRPRVRNKIPSIGDQAIQQIIAVTSTAEFVEPTTRLTVCRDPKDDKFFECAVAAGAKYIVSEDRDVLDVGEYQGIRTVSAAEFIALLVE